MGSVQEVSAGDIIKGGVLTVEDKQVVVDIEGAGIEGAVPIKELSTLPVEDVHELMKVGDVLGLVVITSIGKDKEDGSYLLPKRRLGAKEVWEGIERDSQTDKVIGTPVTNIVRGGLVVDIGVRGFTPALVVEDHFVAGFSGYKGQALAFKIIEIEPLENRLILPHKAVVGAEKESKKEELLPSLHDGDVVEGKVTHLTDFGTFIGLGGVDGLVHVPEIAYQHMDKLSDVLTIGEGVQIKVLSINPKEGRISLSIKETLPRPWADIGIETATGTILGGTVRRLADFGAFVKVSPGVRGLAHISQIPHKHIAAPHGVLYGGDQVQVKVLEASPEECRIALSIKALESKPGSQKEPREEQRYGLPEENTGSTMGGILGDTLSGAKEEE